MDKKINIGVIGLGAMGGSFALNLINKQFNVYGIDPDKSKTEYLKKYKVKIVNSLNQLFIKCDFLITSLPSVSSYNQLLKSILSFSKFDKQKIIIDMNTISIKEKKNFKNKINNINIKVLDCPVSGTGAQAKEGDISIFASGDKKLIEKCLPILKSFSKEVINVGRFGNGMKYKILANLLVTIHNTATAEALWLGELAGLNKNDVYNTLVNSAATSKMLEKRMPLMINNKYKPATASFNIFMKDIEIIRNFIKDKKVNLPTFQASSLIYDEASSVISQDYDTAAVYKIIKEECN